jgi:hypothetical protein
MKIKIQFSLKISLFSFFFFLINQKRMFSKALVLVALAIGCAVAVGFF